MPWIDDFDSTSNKLSRKWEVERFSIGGENDGQWEREVKDSKMHWNPINGGTETGTWGEWFRLPTDAPGDITIEALFRVKGDNTPRGRIVMGVNQGVVNGTPDEGLLMRYPSSAIKRRYQCYSLTAPAVRPPGWAGSVWLTRYSNVQDDIIPFKIVRKNGYLFMYAHNGEYFVGQYAYNPTITEVDFMFGTNTNNIDVEMWVEYISVWPESVIL